MLIGRTEREGRRNDKKTCRRKEEKEGVQTNK